MNVIVFVLHAASSGPSHTQHSAGLPWRGLRHWIGPGLQIVGVLLAAKGIRDVRRTWAPDRRGIVGTIKDIARDSWGLIRGLLRAFGALLGRRGQSVVGGEAPVWRRRPKAIPAAPTVEERLAGLERDLIILKHDVSVETAALHTADQEQHEELTAEQMARRRELADFAGGGLRLQAWGVGFLLVGTILIGIW